MLNHSDIKQLDALLMNITHFLDTVYQEEVNLMIIDFFQHAFHGKNNIHNYLQTMQATQNERDALYDWLVHGNDYNDNPSLFLYESGAPMDFISALRLECTIWEENTHE